MPMLARYYAHLEASAVEDAVRRSDTNLAQLLNATQKTTKKQRLKRA
jgi:hypothetical protein